MVSGFFTDTKSNVPLGFDILFCDSQAFENDSNVKRKSSISGIKECKYVKKQLRSIWHKLCSIGVTVSIATILKRKGVNNDDKLV